jgi:hypothetical protein
MALILSREFQDGFPQSIKTSLTNLGDMMTVEIKKLAPYANPAQYPNGYPGVPGTLMRSIKRVGEGKDVEIVAGVNYAILRNYYNNLNPQTKHYIERSAQNTLNGKVSQWWRAHPSLSI